MEELNVSNDFQIKRLSLVDAVVNQMLCAIESGVFNVGEKIPSEKILMQEFGVGRSTLREAFKKLESFGVVSIRQGSGTVLLQDNIANMDLPVDFDYAGAQNAVQKNFFLDDCKLSHYLEARQFLELSSFELACERALPQDILAIEESLERHKRLTVEGDHKQLLDIDFQFHGSIIDASHNEFYKHFWQFITPHFRTQISRVSSIPGMIDNAYAIHVKIYQALMNQDVARGKALIEEHIGTISGRMLSKASQEYLGKR